MNKDLEANIRAMIKEHFPRIGRKDFQTGVDGTPSSSHAGTPINPRSGSKSHRASTRTLKRNINASSSDSYNSELDEEEKRFYKKDNHRGQNIKVLQ